MKYYGQLDDVEVDSPVATLDTLDDMNALIKTFEDLYAKMFTLAARPDVGAYHITESVCDREGRHRETEAARIRACR